LRSSSRSESVGSEAEKYGVLKTPTKEGKKLLININLFFF